MRRFCLENEVIRLVGEEIIACEQSSPLAAGSNVIERTFDITEDERALTRRFVAMLVQRLWQSIALGTICLSIIWMAWLAVDYSNRPQRNKAALQVRIGQEEKESLWHPSSWAPTSFFSFALVLVGAGQAGLFFWQLHLIRSSSDDAKVSSQASMKSAEAAMAALDRPWIVIENACHNKKLWITAPAITPRLEVRFQIKNHGKAPAFIRMVRGSVFLHLPASLRASFRASDIPADYIDLPQTGCLDDFVNASGNATDEVLTPYLFDCPTVIACGESSPTFHFHRQLVRETRKIDVNADLMLIGRIWFCGPDEEQMVMNFCYVAGRDYRLQRMFGAPFNAKGREIEFVSDPSCNKFLQKQSSRCSTLL